jgi:hypothetical protein
MNLQLLLVSEYRLKNLKESSHQFFVDFLISLNIHVSDRTGDDLVTLCEVLCRQQAGLRPPKDRHAISGRDLAGLISTSDPHSRGMIIVSDGAECSHTQGNERFFKPLT